MGGGGMFVGKEKEREKFTILGIFSPQKRPLPKKTKDALLRRRRNNEFFFVIQKLGGEKKSPFHLLFCWYTA